MIVVDASAIIEILLQTPRAERLMARALNPMEGLHAPHLLDIEVTHVLRRLVLQRQIPAARGVSALQDLRELVIERHSHEALLSRIWQLRDSMTCYDAAYASLAEALRAPLLTCDRKLAGAHGHTATVELIE